MAVKRTALVLLLCASSAAPASAAKLKQAKLWQERFFWDGLFHARDRAARQAADPRLLEVVYSLAQQVAQQAVNIQQIQTYTKAQLDSLRFAFAQTDPEPSLAVIRNNLATLSKGGDQIRNNLYYLTTRARMASSQALPDQRLTEKAMLLIAQVQNVQLKLNALYTDTVPVVGAVRGETWAADDYLRHHAELLMRSVVGIQDSVFAVYNASYELYQLSRQ